MRFDVNTSIAPIGSTKLGIRSEVKNLNSFRSVERAVEHEFCRQVEVLESGEKVIQETRGWDDAKQKTTSQRNKENAQDYRYMPDADIPPIILSDEENAIIQAEVPSLPPFYRESWKDIGFDSTVMNALLASKSTAELIQRVFEKRDNTTARRVGLWMLLTVEKCLTDDRVENVNSKSAPDEFFIELSDMVEANELSSTAAKEILFEMLRSFKRPRIIATQKNLIQVNDEDAVMKVVDEVLNDNASQKAVEDFKNGNEKTIGFLIGQVMKKSGENANPTLVQKLIRKRIV